MEEKKLFKVIIGTKTRKGNWVNEIVKICSAKTHGEAQTYYCNKYSPFLVEVFPIEGVPEEVPEKELSVAVKSPEVRKLIYKTDVIKKCWDYVGYSSFPCSKEEVEILKAIRKERRRLAEEYDEGIKKEVEKLQKLLQEKYPHLSIDKTNVKLDYAGFTFHGIYRHGIYPVVNSDEI